MLEAFNVMTISLAFRKARSMGDPSCGGELAASTFILFCFAKAVFPSKKEL